MSSNPLDGSQVESQASIAVDELSPNAVQLPSQLEAMELFNTLTTWFRLDRDFSQTWRTQTKDDFRFIAGEQWLAEDKKTLEDQGRPAIVFNRALPIIKSVAGIE